ncbi:MAG: hypothetical protein ACRCUJ_01645 [Phocaeicola sp.]
MSKIDFTYMAGSCSTQLVVCMTASECRILLATLEASLKKAEAKYDKYIDIRDSGYATTKDENLFAKYEEQYYAIESVVKHMRELIKKEDDKK